MPAPLTYIFFAVAVKLLQITKVSPVFTTVISPFKAVSVDSIVRVPPPDVFALTEISPSVAIRLVFCVPKPLIVPIAWPVPSFSISMLLAVILTSSFEAIVGPA